MNCPVRSRVFVPSPVEHDSLDVMHIPHFRRLPGPMVCPPASSSSRIAIGRIGWNAVCVLVCWGWLASSGGWLWAARFDTAYHVQCRDVTTEEFAALNPRDRLIEARFQITALASDDVPSSRLQYTYQLMSPSGSMQIVDYGPRTTQATSVAGPVSVESKRETSQSLGISVSGSFEKLVHGTAGSDVGTKNAGQIRYELKPPMELALVAGTVHRGTGVFFRLFPTPDVPLEGAREFVVVMRVGQGWRGDVMYVHCDAHEDRRGELLARGEARFVVGLYLEGDEEARDATEQLLVAEIKLRRAVARHRREIDRRSVPTVLHRLGAKLDMYQPPIPDAWLDRVLYGSTRLDQHAFVEYLPEDVRLLTLRYAEAKRRVYELGNREVANLRRGEPAIVAAGKTPDAGRALTAAESPSAAH